MNICLVSREYPPETGWGGIGTYSYILAHALSLKGHPVHVIAQGLKGAHEQQDGGVLVHRIAHRSIFAHESFLKEWSLRIEYSYYVRKKLNEIIQRYAIDVVEVPNFSAEGLIYSFFKKVPLVTRLHTHFSEVVQFLNRRPSRDHRYSCYLEDSAVLRSDLVTCSTKAHIALVAKEVGIEEDRVKQIPLGVPLPDTHRNGLGLPHPAILFVGRLEKRKGVHMLMRAIPRVLKEFPQAHFFVVGRDTYMNEEGTYVEPSRGNSFKAWVLRDFPGEYLDRVHFLGYVEPDLLDQYYRECDFLVAPSLYESFGFIYIEAMSYGKPVIGCSVGGVPEVVIEGNTGFLVPPEDSEALARTISKLLRDPHLQKELGLQARRHVEENFSDEILAKNTIQAYSQLL